MNARDKLKALPAYQYGYVMHLLENEGLADLLIEVGMERGRQDELWGGKAHDDENTPAAWTSYIEKQLNASLRPSNPENFRPRMIKVAALALAAVAAVDRKNKPAEEESCGECPACKLAALIEQLEKGGGSVRVVGIDSVSGLEALLSALMGGGGPRPR